MQCNSQFKIHEQHENSLNTLSNTVWFHGTLVGLENLLLHGLPASSCNYFWVHNVITCFLDNLNQWSRSILSVCSVHHRLTLDLPPLFKTQSTIHQCIIVYTRRGKYLERCIMYYLYQEIIQYNILCVMHVHV